MIYFDTAYVAKCYVNEHGSDEVRGLAAEAGRVACCAYGRLELMGAIHRKLREGTITRAQYRIILRQFDSDEGDHIWTWLPVMPELLAAAVARFRALEPTIYLRSADVLHLACAKEHGFKEIWSSDRHLLGAAGAFKMRGRNVIP
ncbi:MAG: type II toxin-antitoxin system VapC family toxin [Chthoniobacteraceae bacterium]